MKFQQDASGPDHNPGISNCHSIDGVITQTSPYVNYLGDNKLTELYRPEWVGVFQENEPIEHLYTVNAPAGGIRKEWYYHEHTLDRYMVLQGLLDVGLYDARENSKTFKNFVIISIGESGSDLPNMLRIPPLVWHSLKWKSNGGMVLISKIPGFNSVTPDKFRIQMKDIPTEIKWNI